MLKSLCFLCHGKRVPRVGALFRIIGKSFGIPYDIKSPPGGIALRRSGRWLPGQPRRRRRIPRAGFFFNYMATVLFLHIRLDI